MEPIRLQNFSQQRVTSVGQGLRRALEGANLVFKISRPNSLYIGNVARQTSIVWRYNSSEELNVFNSGCTFFLWTHSAEFVVVTGLVVFRFELERIDVDATFHVSDAVRFCSGGHVDRAREEMEAFLAESMKGHEEDDFECPASLQWRASLFFEINQRLNRYGVSVNQIEPVVRRTGE